MRLVILCLVPLTEMTSSSVFKNSLDLYICTGQPQKRLTKYMESKNNNTPVARKYLSGNVVYCSN